MSRIASWLSLLVVGFMAVSCAKNTFEPVSLQEYNNYLPSHTKEFILSKPLSERKYLLEYAATAMILGNYLKLDGTNYYLDITPEEAQKLGVSKQMYKAHAQQVAITNSTLQKDLTMTDEQVLNNMRKKGIKSLTRTIHLHNPQNCTNSVIIQKEYNL